MRGPVDVIGVHWASLGGDLASGFLTVCPRMNQETWWTGVRTDTHRDTDGVCEWGGNQLFRRNKSLAKTHRTVWQSRPPHRAIVFIFNYALPWSIIFLLSLSVEQAKSNPTPLAGAVYPGLRRENLLDSGPLRRCYLFSADIFDLESHPTHHLIQRVDFVIIVFSDVII